MTVSNVPGPQVPLYLAGAALEAMYPLSIVVHGVALNFTIQGYMGQLCFGLIACRRAVPDVRDLADDLERAMLAARALPLPDQRDVPAAPTAPPPARKARRRPRLTVVAPAAPAKAKRPRRQGG